MKGAGLGLLEKVNSHNVISPEVKFLPAAPTTRTALCFEGKEGTFQLPGCGAGDSNGCRAGYQQRADGARCITESQGRPGPLVEAAGGAKSRLWQSLIFISEKRGGSQCRNAVALNS